MELQIGRLERPAGPPRPSAPGRRALILLLALAAALLAGCGGKQAADTTPAADVPHWKAWLCRPGLPRDPCRADLTTTVVHADGTSDVVQVPIPRRRPIDCFYVYPTVSRDPGGNSDLNAGPEERRAALTQAARFEQVCRVFAPVYRQTTGRGGGSRRLAYRDVRAAWEDYLAHSNDGRGVVLIGDAQGASLLRQLIQSEIDADDPVRKLIVSAILLGGGVTVVQGSDRGGDFVNVPACRSRTETGCVVAYSAWAGTPPPHAELLDVEDPSERLLCVNPGAPQGGTAPITPAFPWFSAEGIRPETAPPTDTDWIAFPGRYKAHCVEDGTRAWLLVEPVGTLGDARPVVKQPNDARGLHAADVNIALDTLVGLVRAQSAAWRAGR